MALANQPRNSAFNAIVEDAREFKGTPVQWGDGFVRVSASVLLSAKENFDARVVRAMVGVEWPAGMSTEDQMKAMFHAAIDALLED